MSAEHTCFRQVIARGCVVQIERCTCDTLHLVLGPFSLRLSGHHFKSLINTLLEAQSALEQQTEEPQDPSFNLATLLSRTAARGES